MVEGEMDLHRMWRNMKRSRKLMQSKKRDQNPKYEKETKNGTKTYGKFKFFKNRNQKTSTFSYKGLKVSFTSRAFLFFINYSWSEYLFAYMIHWCVVLVCRQCLEKIILTWYYWVSGIEYEKLQNTFTFCCRVWIQT